MSVAAVRNIILLIRKQKVNNQFYDIPNLPTKYRVFFCTGTHVHTTSTRTYTHMKLTTEIHFRYSFIMAAILTQAATEGRFSSCRFVHRCFVLLQFLLLSWSLSLSLFLSFFLSPLLSIYFFSSLSLFLSLALSFLTHTYTLTLYV